MNAAIFSPASGKSIMTPTQDIALGIYYLTIVSQQDKLAGRTVGKGRIVYLGITPEYLFGPYATSTLEGIVLAILAARPAYGYEITARLREQGFSDIAEGTVYALLVRFEQKGLVDVVKIPSEKGPLRKVYSLNAQGQEYLEEFWRTWRFLAGQLDQLHGGGR